MVSKDNVYKYSYENRSLEFLKDKLMEEMAELSIEFFKARLSNMRNACPNNLQKEFADVRLMMKQIEYYYDQIHDGGFSKNIDKYEQYKCDKLWAIWHNQPLPEEPE